jgi:hypothetical protein
VFENAVPRRIFGSRRDHIIGGWRKMYNEELHILYCSPNIIRTIKTSMRLTGHAARMEPCRNACRIFVGRPEGTGSLGRPIRKWRDNWTSEKVDWGLMDWIHLAQDKDQWWALLTRE